MVPWCVPSTEKSTDPVGVPPEPAATVTVKVTESPEADGFLSDTAVVVVAIPLTVWTTLPAETSWFASPE